MFGIDMLPLILDCTLNLRSTTTPRSDQTAVADDAASKGSRKARIHIHKYFHKNTKILQLDYNIIGPRTPSQLGGGDGAGGGLIE